MLLRAARDLSAGEEVTFNYWGYGHAIQGYSDRQNASQKHGNGGFSCCCRRCTLERELCEPGTEFSEALHRTVASADSKDLGQLLQRLEELQDIVEAFAKQDAQLQGLCFACAIPALECLQTLLSAADGPLPAGCEAWTRDGAKLWTQQLLAVALRTVAPASAQHIDVEAKGNPDSFVQWLECRYGPFCESSLRRLHDASLQSSWPGLVVRPVCK